MRRCFVGKRLFDSLEISELYVVCKSQYAEGVGTPAICVFADAKVEQLCPLLLNIVVQYRSRFHHTTDGEYLELKHLPFPAAVDSQT
jgi:hypothetical protein